MAHKVNRETNKTIIVLLITHFYVHACEQPSNRRNVLSCNGNRHNSNHPDRKKGFNEHHQKYPKSSKTIISHTHI